MFHIAPGDSRGTFPLEEDEDDDDTPPPPAVAAAASDCKTCMTDHFPAEAQAYAADTNALRSSGKPPSDNAPPQPQVLLVIFCFILVLRAKPKTERKTDEEDGRKRETVGVGWGGAGWGGGRTGGGKGPEGEGMGRGQVKLVRTRTRNYIARVVFPPALFSVAVFRRLAKKQTMKQAITRLTASRKHPNEGSQMHIKREGGENMQGW